MMATPGKLDSRRSESLASQTALALAGLGAIGMIVLINLQARPLPAAASQMMVACNNCGTVVAVRRSAHSAPIFFVEVQMADGSLRIVQQLAAGFSVGDVVQVNGNALTLRGA
jgi:acid phosphatase class B